MLKIDSTLINNLDYLKEMQKQCLQHAVDILKHDKNLTPIAILVKTLDSNPTFIEMRFNSEEEKINHQAKLQEFCKHLKAKLGFFIAETWVTTTDNLGTEKSEAVLVLLAHSFGNSVLVQRFSHGENGEIVLMDEPNSWDTSTPEAFFGTVFMAEPQVVLH